MKTYILVVFLILNLITFSQIGKNENFIPIYQVDDVKLEGEKKVISNLLSNGEIFSLNWFNSSLYFSSSCKVKSDIASEWNFFGTTNLYKADIVDSVLDENFKPINVKLFSKKIKNGNNTSSMCFTPKGDTAFFMHNNVKKKGDETEALNPQIFMYLKKGEKWKEFKILPFNKSKYSFSDPFYDSKMNRLYFTSNIPNGKGGSDIYYSTAKSGFTDIVNFEKVNSRFDDRNYFSSDNNIFISSNRKGTLGGLDIYWMDTTGEQELRNFEEINTIYDEFGFTLIEDLKNGLLLSGENKSSKPYYINFNKKPVKLNQISGLLKPLDSNLSLNDSLNIVLINGNDAMAYEVKSNQVGYFVFEDIKKDSNYMVSHVSEVELVLTIEDENGKVIKEYLADDKNKYSYVYSPEEREGSLGLISENQVNGKRGLGSLAGRLVYEDNMIESAIDVDVALIDENGIIKQSIKTNQDGVFIFWKIPIKMNYTLTVLNNSKKLLAIISDKNGVVNSVLKDNTEHQFRYKKPNNGFFKDIVLPKETLPIRGLFSYRNVNMDVNHLKVVLLNEDGELAFTTYTDDKGGFEFKKALLEQNYTIKAISDKKLNLKLFYEDGEVSSVLHPDHKGLFNYRKLKSINVGTLSLIPEGQMDLTKGTGYVTGQLIYMNDFSRYPGNVRVSLVDTNGQVAYEQVTDEMGNFEFKSLYLKTNYLFKTDSINDNLIMHFYDHNENVISQLKCDSMGYFKFRKLNSDFTMGLKIIDLDSNQVIDFESKMLFGSFKYRNLKTSFTDSLTVYIYDDEGILIATEKVNKNGDFRFRNLPVKNNFYFKLESEGELMRLKDFTLYVTNRFGKKVALLQYGDKGYFKYRPLGLSEINELKIIDEFSNDFTIDDPKLVMVKVYFNTNKKNIVKRNLKLLNKVKDEMLSNPNLKLEINAYADSRSSDDYNLILSGKRGNWIMNFLIRKGIPESQFIVNSYGEGQLAIDCEDCTDEDHAKNRRAELRMF